MKKVNFSRISSVLGIAILTMGLLSACNKKDSVDTQIPAAGLMVFNLAPDQEAIGIALSGNNLTNSPLSYTGFNGIYQNIYTGTREIEAFNLSDSTFSKSSFTFENNIYYSLFVTGNNGVYKNVVVKDEIDSTATPDKAYIRFINAIPDSSAPVVNITAGGTKVVDAPASYTSVSEFTAVNGGEVSIAVSNGNTISANRTITLENGKIYTALLVGVPGETDDEKRVQIRFVQNGNVPAAAGK